MISSLRVIVRKYGAVCALAFAALLAGPGAHAEVILKGGQEAFGKLNIATDLQLQSSGTLGVRVSDLGVPITMAERLDSLTFYIGDEFGHVLASMDSEGLLETWIDKPGTYSLFISAVPSSRFNFGIVSWSADFQPPVVPLPPAIWLLLSGLAWAMGLQRKRAMLGVREFIGSLSWGRGAALAR